jgi:ankyrin repeat protein
MYKNLFSLSCSPLYVALLFMITLFVHCGCDKNKAPNNQPKKNKAPNSQPKKNRAPDQPGPREREVPVTPITDQMIAQAEQAAKVFNKKFLANMLRALKADPESVKNINESDDSLGEKCTAMHYAAQSGEVDIVKALLDRGAKIDIQDNDKALPLHYAVLNGYLDIVELLLDKGDPANDLHVRYTYSSPALYLAVNSGRLDMVKLLADRGARIDVEEAFGYKDSVLHLAAKRGHLEIVRYLVEEKYARLDGEDTYGLTPLYLAAKYNHKEVVAYLVKQGATVDLNQGDEIGVSLELQISKEIEDLLTKNLP